jgi:hypothetical protein
LLTLHPKSASKFSLIKRLFGRDYTPFFHNFRLILFPRGICTNQWGWGVEKEKWGWPLLKKSGKIHANMSAIAWNMLFETQ